MPLKEGSLLGQNLRLSRPLGRGAMGTVWLAENSALGSEVAVKVLHDNVAANAKARKRFEQEAQAVARLDSPHVVRVFDYGVTDEQEPYFVMERLRGRPLDQVLEERGALPPEEAVSIIKQLCRGLHSAHELGLVHRDVKPENIFLVDADGDAFVKVLDFGIAKHRASAAMDLTQTSALLGTPYYMSPEQLVSPKGIDRRADLWSVGVVAYVCVVGVLPFRAETVGALSLAVHKGEFTLPTAVSSELPAALDAFFTRALQVEPEARFQSARDVAEAFEAAVADDATASIATASGNTTLDASQIVVRVSAGDGLARAATLAADTSDQTAGSTAPGAEIDSVRQDAPVARRRLWLGAAGALAMVLFALAWMQMETTPQSAAVSPSSTTVQGPAAAPDLEAHVEIEPTVAEVRVDGRRRELRDGVLILRGAAGESFFVEVRHDGRHVETSVIIGKDGAPSHPRLVVAAAPPTSSSARVPPETARGTAAPTVVSPPRPAASPAPPSPSPSGAAPAPLPVRTAWP